MTFTLVGKNYYPTAAFAGFTARGPQRIQVASLGKGPEDGFSGLQGLLPGRLPPHRALG